MCVCVINNFGCISCSYVHKKNRVDTIYASITGTTGGLHELNRASLGTALC